MPLRGTVHDYGLADVLQLIAAGSRSGRLRLDREGDVLELALSVGQVVDARTGAPLDAALGSRLVQAGLLTDEQLGWALAERARTGRSLAHLVIGAGHLSREEVGHHATLQRWETVLGPFTWDRGRYTFEDTDVTVVDGWVEPIPVDQLLRRGLRLVEDWRAATAVVPSRTWMVERRLPLPAATGDDPFAEAFGDDGPLEEPISDEVREVHALAEPGARLHRVLGRSPFDRYETTLALAELVGRGFVVLSPP